MSRRQVKHTGGEAKDSRTETKSRMQTQDKREESQQRNEM